jgi:hypothetical protein
MREDSQLDTVVGNLWILQLGLMAIFILPSAVWILTGFTHYRKARFPQQIPSIVLAGGKWCVNTLALVVGIILRFCLLEWDQLDLRRYNVRFLEA